MTFLGALLVTIHSTRVWSYRIHPGTGTGAQQVLPYLQFLLLIDWFEPEHYVRLLRRKRM